MLEATDQSKDNFYEDIGASSFAFKPNVESCSSFFSGAMSKVINLVPCFSRYKIRIDNYLVVSSLIVFSFYLS